MGNYWLDKTFIEEIQLELTALDRDPIKKGVRLVTNHFFQIELDEQNLDFCIDQAIQSILRIQKIGQNLGRINVQEFSRYGTDEIVRRIAYTYAQEICGRIILLEAERTTDFWESRDQWDAHMVILHAREDREELMTKFFK